MNNAQTQAGAAAEPLRPVLLDKRSEGSKASRSVARAVSLHLEGKLEEALKELHRATSRGEKNAEIYSAMGHIQCELGQYEGGVESYREFLRLEPKNATGWFNLAVCLENLDRWQEAAEKFKTACELQPDRIEAQLGLGICQLHLNEAKAALAAFDKCLAHAADNENALFGKAVALQMQGHLDQAAELYRGILQRNPNAEESLSNLIAVGMAKKDYDMVRDHSERLLEIHPESTAALEGLAAWASANDDVALTAKFCTLLTAAVPDHFEGWFNLGLAHQKAGHRKQAADDAGRGRPPRGGRGQGAPHSLTAGS